MKITIFTPTYNRAYILPRAYESIKMQEYSDVEVEWVIMDDGSADNTKELVESWQSEHCVCIKYYYQENQGRFSAFNHAKPYFSGDLVAFLDSDDYFFPNAIQKLADAWNQVDNQLECSGVIAYMGTNDNKLVGSSFPEGVKFERIYRLYDRYGIQGDKFLMFRNDLVQKYEYPLFSKERFGGDSILFNYINSEFPMYLLREKISFREYMEDSITKNLLKYHLNSKNGMREHYKNALQFERFNQQNIMKHCIGFVAFSKITGKNFGYVMRNSPKKIRTFLMYPAGILHFCRLKKAEENLK